MQDTVPYQGLLDRKFEILYGDGNAGGTMTQKLWTDKHQKESDGIICTSDNQELVVICNCCTKYTEWKGKHQTAAKLLQMAVDTPYYYKISDKEITVGIQPCKSIIQALRSAPKGPCKGVAYKFGPRPYTCDAYKTVQHDKNSPLLHKLGHALKLKHPQTVQNRATQCGISHKYCSKELLEIALQNRALVSKTQKIKVTVGN